MYYKIIAIIIFIIIYNNEYNEYIEGIQFNAGFMHPYYKKYGITINPYYKTLTKNRKTISYVNGLNDIVAKKIARNKYLTKLILQKNNIPTPHFYYWDPNKCFFTNMKYVRKLNFPIVIKPNNLQQGSNVYSNIQSKNRANNIISNLLQLTNDILIEEHYNGDIYRVFIQDDKIISIYKKLPPRVIGDGYSTVFELIQDFLVRSNGKLNFDQIDLKYIKNQGYNMSSTPVKGAEITITHISSASISSLTFYVDIKDVHPDNIEMFKKVSKILNLYINGLDYITYDLKIPYYQYGTIIEANGSPGIIGMHKVHPQSVENIVKSLKFE